jgi:hypothetical protein
MKEEFLSLQKDISLLPIKNNLVCFLIYGSMLENNSNANDFDAIIVVKTVDSTLNNLFKILLSRHNKLDINIYSLEEISSDLSFFTREFKLEYLAKGLCLYGKNIFINEYLKVSNYKYKQSMLIRSIERLQMVRQKYFTASISPQEKINYLKKYFLRISKSILILQNKEKDSSLSELNQNEINQKLFESGIFNILPNMDAIETADEYFNLFNMISKALIKCKKNFDLQYTDAPKEMSQKL